MGLGKGTSQRHIETGEGRWYVYRLHYPSEDAFGFLAGQVFYVGKGTGNRLLEHEKETRRILKSGHMMYLKHKHKVIIQIWDAGYNVVQEIFYRTEDEDDAYAVESKQIRAFGLERLTNATYGRRPRKKGVRK